MAKHIATLLLVPLLWRRELPAGDLGRLSQLSRLCIGQAPAQDGGPGSERQMERWAAQLACLPALGVLELAGADFQAHASRMQQRLPAVSICQEMGD